MARLGVFAALVLLVFSPVASAQQSNPLSVLEKSSADEVATFLRGTWLITVQGQQRTRQMVLRDARPQGGRFVLDAFYGWSDVTPTPVTTSARVENGVVILDLTTQTNSRIEASSTADSRLDGTFRNPDGKTFPASLERVSTSTALRRVSNTPTALFEPGAKPTAESIEGIVYGTWLVTVGKESRTRNMEIRSVEDQAGRFVAEAVYGWTEGTPQPAPMTVNVDNGIVALDLITSAKSRIIAKSVSPDRFVGTMTTADGKELAVRLMQTGQDVSSTPVAASSGPAGRAKEVTVIYIGADNCPPCQKWNHGRGSDVTMGRYAFLDSPEGKVVKFQVIGAATYMNTGLDQYWPENLRWVRQKTHASSGTPRFILIADGKVVANVTRAKNLRDVILPKIRELTGMKTG